MAPNPRSVFLVLPLALAACVSEGPYPSLAPRPGEGNISLAEPERPDVAVASDPALRGRIAELRAQADAGQRAFDVAYGPAASAIGRAGPSESESWIEAQQALSRLEAARGPTTSALVALDALSTERSQTPTNDEDFVLIGAAIEAVSRIAGDQETRLGALRSRLGN